MAVKAASVKTTVVLVLSTDCPVAMQYTPRINLLQEEFKDVQFKAYFPNMSLEKIRLFMQWHTMRTPDVGLRWLREALSDYAARMPA